MFKKRICLLLALVLCAAVILPAAADSTPAIYKVTDSEGHVIWLMGTVHTTTDDCYPIAGIAEILDECDVLVLESVSQEDAQADAASDLISGFLMPEGNGLSEELLSRVSDAFVSHGVDALAPYTPYLSPSGLLLFLNMFFLNDAFGGETHSVEEHLIALAAERGLELRGMENAGSQAEAVSSLNAIDGDSAVASLQAILDDPDSVGADRREMMEMWRSGDVDALLEFTRGTLDMAESESEGERELYRKTLGDRNTFFAQGALDLLAGGGRALMAVGCLHIVDPATGVIRQLEDAGCTVERVYAEAQ
ncbi:MAG: TraB/GumN family protein [Clostridia bacterium]|nr:TraB/GumN family protein [Clostridia bacterium]